MRGYGELDTVALVRLAQKGDTSALARLCQREYAPLLRYAASCTSATELEPGDLLNMAWEKLIPALPSLQNPALFRPWAVRTIQRLAIKNARSGANTEVFDETHVRRAEVALHASALEEKAIRKVDARTLLSWMATYLDAETISIVMFRSDGLTWKETAAQMNVFHPGARPWTKRVCERRVQEIFSRSAGTLRRLIGGNEQ